MKRASTHFWCAVAISAFVLVCGPAAAQDADSPSAGKASESGGKAKSAEKKTKKHENRKTAKAEDKTSKTRQFASEDEAKEKCPGTVVWVDKDQINHYEGARAYGQKPGAFACEPE
jgi:hypothetical protein